MSIVAKITLFVGIWFLTCSIISLFKPKVFETLDKLDDSPIDKGTSFVLIIFSSLIVWLALWLEPEATGIATTHLVVCAIAIICAFFMAKEPSKDITKEKTVEVQQKPSNQLFKNDLKTQIYQPQQVNIGKIQTFQIDDIISDTGRDCTMEYQHKDGEIKIHHIHNFVKEDNGAFRAYSDEVGKRCLFLINNILWVESASFRMLGLKKFLKTHKKYEICYEDSSGDVTFRTIKVTQLNHRNFEAYCYLREEERTFAYSNVLECEPY